MKKITVLVISALVLLSVNAQQTTSIESNLAHWSLGIKGGIDYYRVTPSSTISWAVPDLFVQYDINPYFGLGLDAGMFNFDRTVDGRDFLGKTIDIALYGSVNLLNVFSVNSPRLGLYGNFGVGAGIWNNEIPEIPNTTKKNKGVSPMGLAGLSLTYNIAPAFELFLEGQYRSYTQQWMGGEGQEYGWTSSDAIAALIGFRIKLGAKSASYGHARNLSGKTYQILSAPDPLAAINLQSYEERFQNIQSQINTLKDGQAELKDIPKRVKKLEEDVDALKEFNRLRELKEGESLLASLSSIEFKFDSSELTEQSYFLLDQIADKLNSATWSSLTVTGHTDNVGTAGYNKQLSKRRAETVKSYLVGKGVSAASITTDGLGSDKPLKPNTTAANRSKNRRVDFKVVK
ncbi:MAG: OmpA family protein [Paludibacter sp.]|jgi:OOP family OmpA-OmpF porin|nr:OmpA family protein [Paludibacter sp.]